MTYRMLSRRRRQQSEARDLELKEDPYGIEDVSIEITPRLSKGTRGRSKGSAARIGELGGANII